MGVLECAHPCSRVCSHMCESVNSVRQENDKNSCLSCNFLTGAVFPFVALNLSIAIHSLI